MIFPVAALFLSREMLLATLAGVTALLLVWELLRLRWEQFNRPFLRCFRPLMRPEETQQLTGSSYVLFSSFLVFLFFPRDIAVMAISFLAVGDAVGAFVGERIGKRRLFHKTWEGSLAGLLSCLGIGFLLSFAALDISWLAILVGSVVATVVEVLPLPLNDNLSIPLGAAVAMSLM
jgi:glycerol-3-phosphate acyltransferase PlsY